MHLFFLLRKKTYFTVIELKQVIEFINRCDGQFAYFITKNTHKNDCTFNFYSIYLKSDIMNL